MGCNILEVLIGGVFKCNHNNQTIIYQKLDASHCLFVLGGDMQLLLTLIHARNLKGLFTDFYHKGLPFAGASAGCIWVSKECMSDSESFHTPEKWKYIMLSELDFLPAMNVHDNQGIREGDVSQMPRDRQFDAFMQKRDGGKALAIDEFAAIYVTNNEHLEVISFDKSGVQIVTSSIGSVYRERIAGSLDLSDYFL